MLDAHKDAHTARESKCECARVTIWAFACAYATQKTPTQQKKIDEKTVQGSR